MDKIDNYSKSLEKKINKYYTVDKLFSSYFGYSDGPEEIMSPEEFVKQYKPYRLVKL